MTVITAIVVAAVIFTLKVGAALGALLILLLVIVASLLWLMDRMAYAMFYQDEREQRQRAKQQRQLGVVLGRL